MKKVLILFKKKIFANIRNIVKIYVVLGLGFSPAALRFVENLCLNEFWSIIIFIILSIMSSIGFFILLSWAFEK